MLTLFALFMPFSLLPLDGCRRILQTKSSTPLRLALVKRQCRCVYRRW